MEKQKIRDSINNFISEAENFKTKGKVFNLNTPIDLHDEIPQWGRHPVSSTYLRQHDKFNDLINRIFSHFEANPSIEEKSDRIKKSYVMEGSAPHYLRWLNVANDGGISELFFSKLTEEIKNSKNLNLRNGNYKRHFYLIGPKGCGKTTFINYLLTQKEAILNEKHDAVTIRINSTLLNSGCSITEGLKYQICKVLFSYYCLDAPNKNINEESLKRRFFSLDDLKEYNIGSDENIESFFAYFVGKHRQKTNSLPMEFNSLFLQFIIFLQNEHNINFLFIVDNLDQLGVQNRDTVNYKKRIDELSNLLDDDDFRLGIFLIVLRTNTFFEIKSKFTFSIERSFTLKIPSIDKIYSQRKKILQLNKELFENIEEQNKYIDTYVRIVGSSFVNRIKENKYVILSLSESLKMLEKYAAYNKRQMINIFRLFGQKGFKGEKLTEYIGAVINNENLEKDLSGLLNYGYYRFFESLMLSETGYCCRHHGYSFSSDNNRIEYNNRSEEPSEHNIIPNIFSFPFIKGKDQKFTPFVKIRILQALRNLLPTKKISINDLKSQLNQIFGYDYDVIELSCFELIEANCLVIGNYQNVFYEYSQNTSQINITDRGELILDTFPIKTNYLSICFEDIAFPVEFQIPYKEFSYEQALPIANYFDKPDFIVKNILFSVPKVIGLLNIIEKNEFELYEEKGESLSLTFHPQDFQLITFLKRDADSTFRKIIDSFLTEVEIKLFNKLPLKFYKFR